MNNQPKWSLLAKYLSGECTDNEKKVVEKWLESDKNNAVLLNSIKSIWAIKESNLKTSDLKAMWSKVAESILLNDAPENRELDNFYKNYIKITSPPLIFKLIQHPAIKYAAAFLVVVLISVLYYINIPQNSHNNFVAWKTIVVENGEQSTITLSDGSKLILDAGSRLQYPEKFNSKSREIKLEGEAYLEIEHNPQKPFRLYTSNAMIQVLGTRFNVRSWKEIKKVEVAVVDGKVALGISTKAEKQITIEKGFAAALSSEGNLTKPERVDIDSYLSWMNGKISFDDVPFSEISAQVERWYNIRFSIQDSTFINDRLTVTIHKNSLSNVLKILSALTNTKYVYKDDVVTFSSVGNKQ